jgi:NAD-dependent SIR2 family protein deacetylase
MNNDVIELVKFVKLKCEKCEKDFEWDKVYNEKVSGDIREYYYMCPHCGDKHSLGYNNGLIRGAIQIIKEAREDYMNAKTQQSREHAKKGLISLCLLYKESKKKLDEKMKIINKLNEELSDYTIYY